MLPSQCLVDAVAERIERAYRLRRPRWRDHVAASRVASVAAKKLLGICRADQSMPLDPELYVAAQPMETAYPDAWRELTSPDSADHFRARVREIVEGLRTELTGEVASAEEQIVAGRTVAQVLGARTRRLSPLARYIVARRAGRWALANRFLPDALMQHRSCPLYRQAVADLIDADDYPTCESARTKIDVVETALRRSKSQAPLN